MSRFIGLEGSVEGILPFPVPFPGPYWFPFRFRLSWIINVDTAYLTGCHTGHLMVTGILTHNTMSYTNLAYQLAH